MATKKEKGVNPVLEESVNALLKQVMDDPHLKPD